MKRIISLLLLVIFVCSPVYTHTIDEQDCVKIGGIALLTGLVLYYAPLFSTSQESVVSQEAKPLQGNKNAGVASCGNSNKTTRQVSSVPLQQCKTAKLQESKQKQLVEVSQLKSKRTAEQSHAPAAKNQPEIAASSKQQKLLSIESFLDSITWRDMGGLGLLVLGCWVIKAMQARPKNAKLAHILLYENIKGDCCEATALHKQMCSRIEAHQKNKMLDQKEAAMVTEYVTRLRDELYKCHATAHSLIKKYKGRPAILEGDMSQLEDLDERSCMLLEEIERLFKNSKGEIGARFVANQLSEGNDDPFEVDQNELIDYSKVDIHKEPKNFKDALIIARAKVIRKRKEEYDAQLRNSKNALSGWLLIVLLPANLVQFLWLQAQSLWLRLWGKHRMKSKQMLLCHEQVLHAGNRR